MSTPSPAFALALALALAACEAKPDEGAAEAKPEAEKTEASKPEAAKQAEPERKPSPDLEDPFKDGGPEDAADADAPRIVLGCDGPEGVTIDGEPVEGSGAELDGAVVKQITARLAEQPELVGVVSCDGDDAATRALHLLELLRDNGVTKIGNATQRKVNPALEDPFKRDADADPAEAKRKVAPDLSDPFKN